MKVTKQFISKYDELMKEYLETLDDTDKDETYDTDYELAKIQLENFLNWLIEKVG